MGIAGFTEWFLKTFPKTVTKVGSGNVPADHVFIDFNQFVHKVSRSSRSYNILWKKMYKELDTILNITNPRQSVYIVMDGPASRAKLIEQRKHRKVKKSSSSAKKVKGIVDRRMITPGCRFTGQILNALAFFICQRLSSRKYEHIKFFVSGANVAGEGELKIMKYISSMPEHMRTRDSFALVGSDADLVLLAIASRVPNVHILNSVHTSSQSLVAAIPNRDRNHSQQGPSRGSKGETFIEIEIDKLVREFSQLVPQSNSRDIGVDFVALSIMSGNDYLPKVPTYFINQYWDHYVKARKSPQWADTHLIDPQTNRLNLKFLDSLLKHSPPRPLTNPPIHHHRKLAKLRKLRADLASGAIDKQDIIRKFSRLATGAQAGDDAIDPDPELLQAVLAEEAELKLEEDDEFVEDDDDDVGDASAMQVDVSEVHTSSYSSADGMTQAKLVEQVSAKIPISAPKATFSVSSASSMQPSPSNTPVQNMRDPIDIFLDYQSRDTWEEYDADDHASEFIYGLEWVVNSYLTGECVNNDWFFPYSSAPGPKQIRDWITKAQANPHLVKSLPPRAQHVKVATGVATEKQSQTTSSGSISIPIHSSSEHVPITNQSSGSAVVFQPWMFAMMLLDSTTYNFISPVIPTHLIQPNSYVYEVHDPSYFFGFVDSDRMADELSKLQLPQLPAEDAEYSLLGNIRMYERSYDRHTPGYIPVSPFEEDSHTERARSLYGSFRRLSVADLRQHHSEMEQQRNRKAQRTGNAGHHNQADSSSHYYQSDRSHPQSHQNQQRSYGTANQGQQTNRRHETRPGNSTGSEGRHRNQAQNPPRNQSTGQGQYAPKQSTQHGHTVKTANSQPSRQYHSTAEKSAQEASQEHQAHQKSYRKQERRPQANEQEPESKRPFVPSGHTNPESTTVGTRVDVNSLFSAPSAPYQMPQMAPTFTFPTFDSTAFQPVSAAPISQMAPLLPTAAPFTQYTPMSYVPLPQTFPSNPFPSAPSAQPSNPFLQK
jgi:hypothetical protein